MNVVSIFNFLAAIFGFCFNYDYEMEKSNNIVITLKNN